MDHNQHAPAGPSTARPRRNLGEDCIEIWYCPLDRVEAQSLPLASLAEEEIARYRRFASSRAALQFLAGRVLMRAALSAYADVGEHAWRFQAGEHGRPYVAEPIAHRDFRFNLSHTAAAVVLAVGRRDDLGIDIQTVDQNVDVEGIGRAVFTTSEMAWVSAGQTSLTCERFFDLWTLKEAYMKARGKGFNLDPKSFALAQSDGRFRLCNAPACETDPDRWQFHLFSPRADLRMALAVGNKARIKTGTSS